MFPIKSHLPFYPIIIFVISAIFCLGSSAIFHTFFIINPLIHKILHRIDLAGISILVWGSSFSLIYYYFYCKPLFLLFYTVINFITCFSVFIVNLFDRIHLP